MPRDTRAATTARVANSLAKHPEILELVKQGLPAAVIARRVGVSKRTVSRVRGNAGLSIERRRATEDDKLRAKTLLHDGASYAEVARTIGFHPRHVKRWFPGYAWTLEQREEFSAMVRRMDGLTWMRDVPCKRQRKPWDNLN